MAGYLLSFKEPERALQHLKLAFKNSTSKEVYMAPISRCLEKLDRLRELEYFYVLMINNSNAESYRRLGWLQVNRGKIDEGLDNLEKAESLDPGNRLINLQLS